MHHNTFLELDIMFKKVLLIIFLLFILVGNHAIAPSKDFTSKVGGLIFQPFQEINIAFAAEQGQPSSKTPTTVEPFSWSSFIVPGTAGIVLIIVIGSYWLVYKKRLT
jgi:hypothetical protein